MDPMGIGHKKMTPQKGPCRKKQWDSLYTYLGHLQPTYIGVIIQLLSTMDILVGHKERSVPKKKQWKSSGRSGTVPKKKVRKGRNGIRQFFLLDFK